ncbi:MAG: MdtA/MuxA family multidrug efflux RND transporter periplasmic adaptor subunit [Acetobacteraceae bacterium]|nr:MdtA/MuxA family multidrug efflux RND transporter periplasmic adaptor subunit [Acetobacteraceae bacterium]
MDDQAGRSYGDMQGTVRPTRRRGWVRPLLLLILALLIAAGLWYGWQAWERSRQPTRAFAQPPQSVGAATVGRTDIRVLFNALGTVTSLATVTVKTQIAGKITDIGFTEGQVVQKGDFLAQIDPRPYQVALENAQGALARDQAQLQNARLDLKRYQTLVAQDSASRQQRDTQAALVRQYEGTILVDQAAVDSAQLNLTYCRIVSPITGKVGLRQVDIGNYVQPSDATGLVVIAQIHPISVVYALPEDDIPAVQRAIRTGRPVPTEAWDRADRVKLEDGALSSVDNQVDVATGTVKLRSTFANPDELLFPNEFVNAKLLVDTLKDTVAIPTAAVQRGEPGTFVYLIDPDSTVHVQKITLGPVDGANVAVLQGLKPGDRIVIDGADRLKDGAKVIVPPPATAPAAPAAANDNAAAAPQSGDADGPAHRGGGRRRGERTPQ